MSILVIVIVILPSFNVFAEEVAIGKYGVEVAEISTFIQDQMEIGKIPGISVVVVEGENIVYQKSFGYADLKSENKVDQETLFELASNSKAFTGLGILKMIDDGLINMNSNVKEYLPWLTLYYDDSEVDVTVEQLLHHTSGISSKTISMIQISNNDNALENTVKTLVDTNLDTYPGDDFQYATINYDVLGLIIQEVSGVSYEEYILKEILVPLGLSNTYLFNNDDTENKLATGYKIGFLRPIPYKAPIYRGNKPAGYIMSNISDIGKWLKLQIGTGDVKVFDNLIAQSHIPDQNVTSPYDDSSYAIGWTVKDREGLEIIHGGNNPNYSSYMVIRPEEEFAVAVLSNINSSYTSVIGHGIKEKLLNNDYIYMGRDNYEFIDKIGVVVILIGSIISLLMLILIVRRILRIVHKKSSIKKLTKRCAIKMIILFVFVCGISYFLNTIPSIFFGASWGFVFVWYPFSIRIALYLVYMAIWSIYLFITIGCLSEKNLQVVKNDE